jgi:hypothetical protein
MIMVMSVMKVVTTTSMSGISDAISKEHTHNEKTKNEYIFHKTPPPLSTPFIIAKNKIKVPSLPVLPPVPVCVPVPEIWV